MLSFWQIFHYWLHWKLSFWQLPVQPVMKILSKWKIVHFHICWSLFYAIKDPYSLELFPTECQPLYSFKKRCWKGNKPLSIFSNDPIDVDPVHTFTAMCDIRLAGVETKQNKNSSFGRLLAWFMCDTFIYPLYQFQYITRVSKGFLLLSMITHIKMSNSYYNLAKRNQGPFYRHG